MESKISKFIDVHIRLGELIINEKDDCTKENLLRAWSILNDEIQKLVEV